MTRVTTTEKRLIFLWIVKIEIRRVRSGWLGISRVVGESKGAPQSLKKCLETHFAMFGYVGNTVSALW